MTVILDTEYTTWPGAMESGWSEPGQHREIVQIGAIAVDASFRELRALKLLVRPTINPDLSELFTTLTGVTQAAVDADGMDFPDALGILHAFIAGDAIVCMSGDERVFAENCAIHRIEFPFAPFHRLRPLLEEQGVNLSTHSSGDLHRLTPEPLAGHTHDALHDVRSMAAWMADAARRGVLADVAALPTGAPEIDPRSAAARP